MSDQGRIDALQALFDASVQDNAALERELRDARDTIRELLEMGVVLQQERDAARRLAKDALVCAGFADTLSDIASLPTWGET